MPRLAAALQGGIQHISTSLTGTCDAISELVVQLRDQPTSIVGKYVVPFTTDGGYDSAGL